MNAAMEKRKTKKQRILDLLSDGKIHHMRELNAITYRYGGRIHELRHEQHLDIETIHLGVDETAYRMRIAPVQGVLV